MKQISEIIEKLQSTALTPEQAALVKQLANMSGSYAKNIKDEIYFLLEQETSGDSIKVDDVKAIIARAGSEL